MGMIDPKLRGELEEVSRSFKDLLYLAKAVGWNDKLPTMKKAKKALAKLEGILR